MTLKTFAPGLTGALGLFLASAAWAAGPDEGTPINLKDAKFNQVREILGVAGLESTGPVRTLEFQPAEWPGMTVKPAKPWDWSKAGSLVFDLENPESQPVEFNVRIDDDPKADGVRHCRTAHDKIDPKAHQRFAVSLGGMDPMSVGVRALPGPAGCRTLVLNGASKLDMSHIVAFVFFMHQPSKPTSLRLNDVRVRPALDMNGCIDRFGQYARADWPGKVHDEADLSQQSIAEAADLAVHPAMPDRDRFGGWAKGPKQQATGFFRTAKVDGKWWLVDPYGGLFFSSGVDCVGGPEMTMITGREAWFAWLPDASDPLAKMFGRTSNIHSGPVKAGRTFDFLKANQARKYGPEFAQANQEMALKRLPSWGFNTVANWSDTKYFRNGRVPYTATAGIRGAHKRVSSGSDYWGQMHDPFDPAFAADVVAALASLSRRSRAIPGALATSWITS